jgi:hypothetical protein
MTFRVADLMLEPVVAAPKYEAKKVPGGGPKCQEVSRERQCKHCTKLDTCEPCTSGPTGQPSTCTSDTAAVTACSDCQNGTVNFAQLTAAMQAKLEERAYTV